MYSKKRANGTRNRTRYFSIRCERHRRQYSAAFLSLHLFCFVFFFLKRTTGVTTSTRVYFSIYHIEMSDEKRPSVRRHFTHVDAFRKSVLVKSPIAPSADRSRPRPQHRFCPPRVYRLRPHSHHPNSDTEMVGNSKPHTFDRVHGRFTTRHRSGHTRSK